MKKILLLQLLLFAANGFAEASKPNIIIIYTDDQSQEDISAFGNASGANTTNIDRLAKNGVKFDQFYSAAPICSASRAALMTGKTPDHAGFNSNAPKTGPGLPLRNKTMAEAFNELGYKSYIVGKWHLGETDGYKPTDRGFIKFSGHLSGCIDNYTHMFRWNGTHKDSWIDSELTDLEGKHFAKTLIEEARKVIYEEDNPFFLYYAINQPHYPIQPLGELRKKYDLDNSKDGDLHYKAFIETTDLMVGALLKDLEDTGKLDNTIIVFQSDHGHSPESRNWDGIDLEKEASGETFRSDKEYSYSGSKFTLLEGGIRVPAIISWPNHLPKNITRKEMAVNVDWLPTLTDLVGGISSENIDGKSLVPMIFKGEAVRKSYFWKHFRSGWAIREGEMKLIKYAFNPFSKRKYDTYSMFNVKKDPKETIDIKNDHKDLFEKLKAKGEKLSRKYED